MNERLIDLDELILRCRTNEAKAYIAEAVACYRAGAFRACIVATWVAVVFDFLSKLDELRLTGDNQAKQKLQEFENFRKNNNIPAAQQFERDVLKFAKDDFEFITPIECQDFDRLLQDRNRCAHPSMNTDNETYQPTAELARYHLHNTVAHLLQHPPVQGKAALDRLMNEVSSECFPTEPEKAKQFFEQGPLSNPRESLVSNFTTVLIKSLLQEPHQGTSYKRHAAALSAVRQMHRTRLISEATIKSKLNSIIRSLDDAQFNSLPAFLQSVQDVWHMLEDDVRLKIRNFVATQPEQNLTDTLPWLLDFEPLRDSALARIPNLSPQQLAEVIASTPRIEFVDKAIECYSASKSFDQANSQADTLIMPLIPYINTDHIKVILNSAAHNNQIYQSHRLPVVLQHITEAGIIQDSQLSEIALEPCLESPSVIDRFGVFLNVTDLDQFLKSVAEDGKIMYPLVGGYVLVRLDNLLQDSIITQEVYESLVNQYNLGKYAPKDDDIPW